MAGWLLVVGSVAFIVGASNPALFQVWSAPQATQLRLIHDVATAWAITNVLFLVATVLTAAGLWFVPDSVGSGGMTIARAATVAYLLGATAWIASLVFRLEVTPEAASSFVGGVAVDPAYVIIERWSGGLFSTFTYLAGGSLVALGVAIILGGAISAFAGWFAVVIGAVIIVAYAVVGDMPPVVSYLPTGLLGIVLLLQRSG